MFVERLRREIKSWEYDESVFIKTPINQATQTRAESFRLITEIQQIIASCEIDRKPIVGFSFEDSSNWIISILAAQIGDFVTVPIPLEFTTEQIESFVPHLDIVLTDSFKSACRLNQIFKDQVEIKNFAPTGKLNLFLLKPNTKNRRPNLPIDAIQVIHTSGSTNRPKGVVISRKGLDAVISSMLERVTNVKAINYISVLPYSLLLEQILGIYLPVLTGGSISILPRSILCYTGTQNDLEPYLKTLRESSGNFAMLPPSFLIALQKQSQLTSVDINDLLGTNLKIIATGGAPIDVSCLEFYRENKIEIYQGYGLSENTSVVAWSYSGPNALGSVGIPLVHNKVRVTDDGEIEVSGPAVFLGYVINGEFLPNQSEWLKTGDVGFLSQEGLLYVTGRDHNLIVLSSGRNVAPEWIESKYKNLINVRDIVVVGHGKPYLSAIIFVDKNQSSESILREAIQHSKAIADQFPEFARIKEFRIIQFDETFYSVSGRILRANVLKVCSNLIENIYKNEEVSKCKTISL